jgi:hypothetical protein
MQVTIALQIPLLLIKSCAQLALTALLVHHLQLFAPPFLIALGMVWVILRITARALLDISALLAPLRRINFLVLEAVFALLRNQLLLCVSLEHSATIRPCLLV